MIKANEVVVRWLALGTGVRMCVSAGQPGNRTARLDLAANAQHVNCYVELYRLNYLYKQFVIHMRVTV